LGVEARSATTLVPSLLPFSAAHQQTFSTQATRCGRIVVVSAVHAIIDALLGGVAFTATAVFH
jgi:hypothetical protein